MERNGTYADNVVIQMISDHLTLSIVVLQEVGNITIGTFKTNIHVGYIPSICHYVAVRSVYQSIATYNKYLCTTISYVSYLNSKPGFPACMNYFNCEHYHATYGQYG